MRFSPTVPRKKDRDRRQGVAMLVVMLVLLMTTATATFAIHATTTEIRSAGYGRQALQAEYLAEGASYAALSRLDALQANGSLIEYLRTDVAAGTAARSGGEVIGRQSNLLRMEMEDFSSATGAVGPPIETEHTNTPSLGPQNAYVPDFTVDGTDLHEITREDAGRDLSGRGAHYYRVTLTAYARMAPPSDFRAAGDDRDYHETAMRSRAVAEVGPFWLGGH